MYFQNFIHLTQTRPSILLTHALLSYIDTPIYLTHSRPSIIHRHAHPSYSDTAINLTPETCPFNPPFDTSSLLEILFQVNSQCSLSNTAILWGSAFVCYSEEEVGGNRPRQTHTRHGNTGLERRVEELEKVWNVMLIKSISSMSDVWPHVLILFYVIYLWLVFSIHLVFDHWSFLVFIFWLALLMNYKHLPGRQS